MTDTPHPPLTARDRQVLEFEARWWRSPGAKRQAITDEFDLSETAYYQRLTKLIDNPAAVEEHPLVVNRLRRARDSRRARRTG